MASLLYYCNSSKQARLLTGPFQKAYKIIRNNVCFTKTHVFYMVFDPSKPHFFLGKNIFMP